MRWLKRIILLFVVLLVVAGALAASSVLLSLDWDRKHRVETRGLPLLARDAVTPRAGLVQIEANGMTFRARVAGLENTGPGLILLHGFPETSAMWGPLIDEAVASGVRVVAFDQRGYSPDARPEGVDAYVVPELAADVIAIADAVGFERFHLVGHDWGCVVGWAVTIQHPQRVLTWTGLSIPHPATLLARLRDELPSYIKIFTAPLVPEAMLSWNDRATLREDIYARARPEDREEYLAVFSEPGALTGALNWYRAITSSLDGADLVAGPVEDVPTLFIWGTQEGWVTPDALVDQRGLVNAPYSELELDAGHYLMQEKPDAVVAAVIKHLGSGGHSP